jgi:signal transduction histidine kinase
VLGILDHGAGVAVEDLDRMFDIGWRADAARTTSGDGLVSSGSGIGLSIARAHGGDVVAELTAGGFRMNVLLPYGAAQERD